MGEADNGHGVSFVGDSQHSECIKYLCMVHFQMIYFQMLAGMKST